MVDSSIVTLASEMVKSTTIVRVGTPARLIMYFESQPDGLILIVPFCLHVLTVGVPKTPTAVYDRVIESESRTSTRALS